MDIQVVSRLLYAIINNYLIKIFHSLFIYTIVFISECWILPSGISVVKVYSFKILLDLSSLISENATAIYILTGNIRQLLFSYPPLPAPKWNQSLIFMHWLGENVISLLF